MKLQVFETSITYWSMYDLSEIVSEVSWSTGTGSQPGKFTFNIQEDKMIFLRNGDIITAKADGKAFFEGKIFTRKKKKNKTWQIIAYDNLRYLKNEDTLVFNASSASARFKTICQTQGLPFRILDNAGYNCAAAVMDQKTYFAMLEDSLEETRKGYGVRYGIRDNAGTLEFYNYNRMITKLVLGDQSLVTDYDYESSIDEAFNAVKVIRENEDKKTREVFTATHAGNIKKWGKLQMVETASDADLNSSQLQKQANDLLRENNKETRTLSLEAVGNISIQAGNSFILRLSDLEREGIKKDTLALVHSCDHSLGFPHTMSLEVEVLA